MSIYLSNSINTAFDQQTPHHFPCSKQPVLDGSQRKSGYFGDLVIAKISGMPEQYQISISGRQSFHHSFDLSPPLAAFPLLFGSVIWALDLYLIRTVRIFVFDTLGIHRISQHMINGSVVCDAIK